MQGRSSKPLGRVGIHKGQRRSRRPSMPLIRQPPSGGTPANRPGVESSRLTGPDDKAVLTTTIVPLAEAVTYLADVARTFAAKQRWVCVVEFAGSSESTYIHVRRGQAAIHAWYGIRISAHLAKYACSSDYQQLLLSPHPTQEQIAQAAESLIEMMVDGGIPIAEPHLVRNEIWLSEIEAADGVQTQTSADGKVIQWRWSGTQQRWLSEHPDGEQAIAPLWIPRQTLDTGSVAAIRHRLNRRERWTCDERSEDQP